jgi:hypothetical protein
MVKHDDLQPPFCRPRLRPQKSESFANGDNVLVPPGGGLCRVLVRRSFRKIHLARLVVDQQPRHGMMGFGEKEFLQGERHRNVIRKPVGAAAYLPEIVIAASADYFNCLIVDDQPDRRVRPFRIEVRHELARRVRDPAKGIAEFAADIGFGNDLLQLLDFGA